jgi:hypothetical protein
MPVLYILDLASDILWRLGAHSRNTCETDTHKVPEQAHPCKWPNCRVATPVFLLHSREAWKMDHRANYSGTWHLRMAVRSSNVQRRPPCAGTSDGRRGQSEHVLRLKEVRKCFLLPSSPAIIKSLRTHMDLRAGTAGQPASSEVYNVKQRGTLVAPPLPLLCGFTSTHDTVSQGFAPST